MTHRLQSPRDLGRRERDALVAPQALRWARGGFSAMVILFVLGLSSTLLAQRAFAQGSPAANRVDGEVSDDDTSATHREQDPVHDNVETIQQRFAIKENSLSAHLLGTAHFRGDFYEQVGYGLALAYYPIEMLGLEVRALHYHSWLNAEAEVIRSETGYIPDTRARVASLLVGGRLSMGYGKVQIADAFIVHFDPQVVLQGGLTFGEEDRLLPTFLGGLSLLLHFDYGFQAQIDLLAIVDIEDRNDRGAVASIGFAPFLSVGWRLDLGAL